MAWHVFSPEMHDRSIDPHVPFVTQDDFARARPWFINWPKGFKRACRKAGWTAANIVEHDRKHYLAAHSFAGIESAMDEVLREPRSQSPDDSTKPRWMTPFPRMFFPLPMPFKRTSSLGSNDPNERKSAPRPGSNQSPTGIWPVLLIACYGAQVLSGGQRIAVLSRASARAILETVIDVRVRDLHLALHLLMQHQELLLHARFRSVAGALKLVVEGDMPRSLSNQLVDGGESLGLVSNTDPRTLADWFVKDCLDNSVEVNLCCLWRLAGMRLAMDAYIWLRCMAKDGVTRGRVTWEQFRSDVGTEQSERTFSAAARRALGHLVANCSDLNVLPNPHGFTYELGPNFILHGK